MTGSTPAELKGEIMGTVYKKTATKPLPAGAKIIVRKGQRLAEWIDAKGKTPNGARDRREGRRRPDRGHRRRTYTAKYRDGSGIVREVATGCRDESAARSVLAELERRAELVQGRRFSPPPKTAMIDHQETPLADHIDAYLRPPEGEGRFRRVNEPILADLRTDRRRLRLWPAAPTLRREALERWLVQRARPKAWAPRTRNQLPGGLGGVLQLVRRDRPAAAVNPFAQGAEGRRKGRPPPDTAGR